jgi:hypothetical protein
MGEGIFRTISLFTLARFAGEGRVRVDTDVSGSVLADVDTGYPCRHDERWLFIFHG